MVSPVFGGLLWTLHRCKNPHFSWFLR
ncbi:MAG: hypothetical protein D4R88_02770 [Methanosarcinales archaeon]|nr:MAG: hypothetical protein D4R88_02770 [Methanosarcinales archaeon]